MADIATGGGEGVCEFGRLDEAWRFKKHGGEHQAFKKAELIGFERVAGERLKAACGAIDGKHWAFIEEGVNTHRFVPLEDFRELRRPDIVGFPPIRQK